MTRFLNDHQRERVIKCFEESGTVRSLITVAEDTKEIALVETHLQDAMDICGIWLEGWDALAGGDKYEEGPAIQQMR
jgi:hypothetical protein